MITKLYIAVLFSLFFSQSVTQENFNVTAYSCTVEFVPADTQTDSMAGWKATARWSIHLPASQRLGGSILVKNPDKRIADGACKAFFEERAKRRSPGDDTNLGR